MDPPRLLFSQLSDRRGTEVEIPNCTAPKPADVLDKRGMPAKAWDFVVHPKAVEQAWALPVIMQTLIVTVNRGLSN